MSDIERGALMYVKWEDPTSQAQWLGPADLAEFLTDKTFISESVGWLVAEDKQAIVIAATINEPNTYVGQVFRIPKKVILELRAIVERPDD